MLYPNLCHLEVCYNLGITAFKIFNWGDISSDIWSEILFNGDTSNQTLLYIRKCIRMRYKCS